MTNRVAFITGASRGIGRATSLAMSQAGYRIVVASPEMDKNEEVAAEVRQCQEALVVDLDLSNHQSIKDGFAQAMAHFGRIDVLVNNAGITRDGISLRMKKDDWDLVLAINLSGAFFAAQQVLPFMIRQRWGRVVNVASVVGQMGNAGQANYVASKAGIIGLTKALAQEVASRGVTVNAVAPGFIETDMTARLPEEVKEKMMSVIAMKRFGKPEDVAAAIRFLVSDDAQYITGHVLSVNGGMYM